MAGMPKTAEVVAEIQAHKAEQEARRRGSESAVAKSPISVFESAAVVRLRSGDVLLYRCPGHLRKEQRDLVMGMLDEVFPNHESIILEGGQDIAVLRPEPGLIWRWRRMFAREAEA